MCVCICSYVSTFSKGTIEQNIIALIRNVTVFIKAFKSYVVQSNSGL